MTSLPLCQSRNQMQTAREKLECGYGQGTLPTLQLLPPPATTTGRIGIEAICAARLVVLECVAPSARPLFLGGTLDSSAQTATSSSAGLLYLTCPHLFLLRNLICSHRINACECAFLVGVRGLEPPTSASRTLRASRLRYTPIEQFRANDLLALSSKTILECPPHPSQDA